MMADIIELKSIEGGKTYSLSELLNPDRDVVLVIGTDRKEATDT